MLKCGWGEKCSPDLPAPLSVDNWVLTGNEGENKNAAQSWVQVCLGVPASAQAVQAGCTVGGVDVSVCVCWPKCRGNGGQSQARPGGICSIGLSPAQVLLYWLCPSHLAEHPSGP